MSLLLTRMKALQLRKCNAAHRDFCRWLLGIAASAAFGGALAVAMSPDALVTETVREVQQIIRQDPELQAGNKQKTLDLVEKKILPHFDFERMTMLAVGKDWARANPEQRQSLVNGFRSLLVRPSSGAHLLGCPRGVQGSQDRG